MADTWLQILVRVKDRDYTSIRDKITNGGELDARFVRRAAVQINNLINAVVSGNNQGNLYLTICEHAANMFGTDGTITCAVATAAGKKVTFNILGKIVELVEGVDFLRGANNASLALALCEAIARTNVAGFLISEINPGNAAQILLHPRYPAGLAPTPILGTDTPAAFTIVVPGVGTAPTNTSAGLVHLLANLDPPP